MNPLTESRQALVAALEPLGVAIYGAPPEVITPPAAVVLPGPDWIKQHTFGSARVSWQITLMATMNGSNAAALERLEQLIWDVRQAVGAVAEVGNPSSPRVMKVGTAELAASDLPINVFVTTTEGEAP